MNRSTSYQPRSRLALSAAALLGLCMLPASAQDAASGPPPGWVGPPPGWSGGVILGAATAPTFEGSRDQRAQPVIGGEVSYRSMRWGTVAMGSRGLVWTPVQTQATSAGIGLSIDPGRVDNGERKLTPLGYRPGGASLRGLGEIKATPLLVANGSLTAAGVSLTGAIRHATTSHQGSGIDVGLAVPIKLGAHARISFAPAVSWADRRFMQAYFGVTPAQSAASGYAVFDARAGVKSAQLGVDFEMAFSRHWHVNASLLARRLRGDAAASPITQKTDQVSGLVGVMYQFQL